jgi:type II secretory pathway pseudopilin PulG
MISLAVVGVLAAVVVPGVNARMMQQKRKAIFKEEISTLSQMVRQAAATGEADTPIKMRAYIHGHYNASSTCLPATATDGTCSPYGHGNASHLITKQGSQITLLPYGANQLYVYLDWNGRDEGPNHSIPNATNGVDVMDTMYLIINPTSKRTLQTEAAANGNGNHYVEPGQMTPTSKWTAGVVMPPRDGSPHWQLYNNLFSR